jgi:hypothetical protein
MQPLNFDILQEEYLEQLAESLVIYEGRGMSFDQQMEGYWDWLRENKFNFHKIDNGWSDTELYTYCEYNKHGQLTWYAFKESTDDNIVGKGGTEDEAIQEYFVAEAESYMDNKYD